MSKNSDYFFVNIKQLYPDFSKPSPLEIEIWSEILQPYSFEEILNAVKSYRKNELSNVAPNPAKFKSYLFDQKKTVRQASLPIAPASYLMKADIKAGRCKYLYPIYDKAVNYVLYELLKTCYSKEELKHMGYGERYAKAVDNGLFASFDEVLDKVYKEGHRVK